MPEATKERVVLKPSTIGDVPVVQEQKGGAIISVEEELAHQAKNAALLERPTGGAISFRSGIISWQGNPIPGNRLKCVVLDAVFENRWYDKPFNADLPSNPACFALARTEAELEPHEEAESPQGGPQGGCEGCPKNAWGSDPRPGSRGKACSQVRRLIMIPDTAAVDKESIMKAEMAIAKLPVTSVRYWGAYVNQLAATVARPPYAVVSEMYTEPHPKHQFHVHFTMVRPIANDLIGPLREKIKIAESYLMAPYMASQNAEPQAPAKESKKF